MRWLAISLVVSLVALLALGYLALRLRRSRVHTQRREAILRSILDSMAEGVVVVDGDGKLILANPAAERLAGIRSVGGRGDRWVAAACDYHLDENTPCPDELAPCRRALRGESCDDVELLVPGTVGERGRWLSMTIRPLLAKRPATGGVIVFSDVTGRKHADEERQKLEELRRELEFRREAAREEERKHIARELHDELGQHLSALRMELSLLRIRWGVADLELMDKTRSLQASVDHVIAIVRNLVANLRPAVLDMGIAAALEWLVAKFNSTGKVHCLLEIDEQASRLDPQQTSLVFRLVQESLTNVVRHAHARSVRVSLVHRLDTCALTVRDDGVGFDPAHRPVRSFGLLGMRERAEMLGGALDIRSGPGEGTLIAVCFPLGAATPVQA
jgi:signal transduction histidine kinase